MSDLKVQTITKVKPVNIEYMVLILTLCNFFSNYLVSWKVLTGIRVRT